MTEIEQELCNGLGFWIQGFLPSRVIQEEEGTVADDEDMYYAYVLITPKIDRLIIKIWDLEDDSMIEIDGDSVFVFDILPHHNDEDDDEDDDDDEWKGYDYIPLGRYGVCGNGTYNGCMIYPTVKCLILDLIESSKNS